MTSRSPRVLLSALVLGLLALQAAWILALPPYGGIDEIDHAYHAAAVARGDWGPLGPVAHGRGELVTVPRDIVSAARSTCEALRNSGRENCRPTRSGPDGTLLAGSSAARYNPVYYAVVGTVARPFRGDAALLVMRVVSALMCTAGLAAAAWCLLRRRRTPWVGAAMLVAWAPTLLYSTTLTAPNGLEMAAGLMVWGGLLTIGDRDVPGSRAALVIATVGGVLLVTLRTLGPVFLVLIVVTVLLARRRDAPAILSSRRRELAVATGIVLVALVASLAWILTLDPLSATGGKPRAIDVPALLRVLPTALLQSVAAFPARNDVGPLFVYPLYLLLLVALLVVGVRVGPRSLRSGLVLGLVLSQVVPLAISLAGARSVGVIWQGRYALPYLAGVAVLAGLAWEAGLGGVARRWPQRRERAVLIGLVGAWLLVQVACIVGLERTEAGYIARGLITSPGWIEPPLPVEALLALVGAGAIVVALLRSGESVQLRSGRADLEPEGLVAASPAPVRQDVSDQA